MTEMLGVSIYTMKVFQIDPRITVATCKKPLAGLSLMPLTCCHKYNNYRESIMTARPLISLVLITALILPTSLSAGTDRDNIEAQNTQTAALLQKSSPVRSAHREADIESNRSQSAGTVSLEEHQELKRKYRGAQNGVQIATIAFVIETTFICIALTAGWIKLYTDCKA